MARQIIKQPNGKYALFSSVVDGFVMYDATVEEIIEYMVDGQRERITSDVQITIAKIEAGIPPYHQFTLTWAEALETHEEHHGKLEEE